MRFTFVGLILNPLYQMLKRGYEEEGDNFIDLDNDTSYIVTPIEEYY